MLKKIIAFFNKEDLDYSQGLVDPFKFHKTFFKVLVAFGVADVEHVNKAKWQLHNTVLYIIGFFSLLCALFSLIHGFIIFDMPHITEAGTYSLLLIYKFLILFSTKQNLPQYDSLQKSMMKDFQYICTEGHIYREKYFENQLVTWKICIFTGIYPLAMGIGMAIFAIAVLIYFLVTQTEGEQGTRPLLFPFWLPGVDFEKTPYYEIAFIFANMAVVAYGYNFIFNVQTQVVWIRHITSKVDIIIWCLKDLLDGIHPAITKQEYEYFSNLIVMRMRKIVIHHQDMLSDLNNYAAVYKKMLLYEQKVCGPIVCLSAYSTVQKLNEGHFQLILPLIFLATVVLHFIPNYFCNFLMEKIKSISDACWNTPFWVAPPVIRPYMVILMQRALRPPPLVSPGFQSISLETFSKTMVSAYSTFNMLRQL